MGAGRREWLAGAAGLLLLLVVLILLLSRAIQVFLQLALVALLLVLQLEQLLLHIRMLL